MAVRTVISLQAITKRFGGLAAVDQVSLDLLEGEFFALLGPSGCGKTTLLRTIAGFEHPEEGTILLDGEDMTRLGANRRPVNLMFQSYALFPHMTVRGNISYGLEMEKLDRRDIARRVDDILEMTQLSALGERKPDHLSGGQRQRVALARALVKRPRVLLLDEPLGALDKKLRGEMQLELKRLQHDLGITFLIVTHDQEEALVMADRIALMKDGRIAQLDSPKVLYEQPRSRFAARFIGVTNLLNGRATKDGIEVPGLGNIMTGETIVPETGCALSLRPERIFLTDQGAADGCNAVRGDIVDMAYHGQDMNVRVAMIGLEQPLVIRVSAADASAGNYAPGQQIWCNWRPEHGRLLTD